MYVYLICTKFILKKIVFSVEKMNEHLNNNDEFNIYYEKDLYNIKKFMKHHPGGTNSLLSKGNKEISNLMNAYDHSDYAYYLLSQYKSKEAPRKNGLSQGENGIHQNGNGIHQNGNGTLPNAERKKMIEKMEKIEVEMCLDTTFVY